MQEPIDFNSTDDTIGEVMQLSDSIKRRDCSFDADERSEISQCPLRGYLYVEETIMVADRNS